MLRKFLGLSEDNTNKRKTEKERQQEYETKRVRRIVPSWKAEFTWLITDDSHGKPFCKLCRSVYGPLATPRHTISDKFKRYSLGPFVVGSCNLRHDSLVTHEKSDGHRYALEYESSLNARTTQAEKALQCLNSAFFEKLDKLFRVAHSIAKKSRPISDFEWICELEDQLKIDIGTAYRNVNSCKQFLFAIADVERGKIEKELSKANFCSIMSDGSTDVSGVENEIVYIHFAVGGVTHCYFVGMIETPCANASGIYCSIMDALYFDRLTKEEIQQKIVAFAGDGAAVNTGKLNGVIALFQNRISRSIIMIQCMAHRVELGMKDAMNKVPLFKKVMELLDDMFRFYKSAKQKSELKLVYEELGLPCTMPTRIGGTRWVGHTLLAVRNMLKGYKGLLTHLTKVAGVRSQSAAQSKAKNFTTKLKSKNIVHFAHFLVDVLSVLSTLSKQLQERGASVYQVHRQLESTLSNLDKLLSRPGCELRKISSSDTFEGEIMTGNTAEHTAQTTRVITGLQQCLQRRFEDLGNSVFKSTKLADLGSWPISIDENRDFGDESLQVVIDHYRDVLESNGVDLAAAEEEWTYLTKALYENNEIHEMTWEKINTNYKGRCDNILQIIDLILSLPASTAECERGFSQMKQVKTQYRNKLKATSMTLLMTIQLHSASISEFDPTEAIHKWNICKRRPGFLVQKSTSSSTISALDDAHLQAAAAAQDEDEPQLAKVEECNPFDSDYDSEDISDED